MTTRLRFAPSPTGYLHLGNLRTAAMNAALAARAEDGAFVLRLDDTDAERSEQRFADAIVEDLAWLGIEPRETVRQSQRVDLYDEALRQLERRGLAYRCYETPDELERRRKRTMARGLPPIYDRAALKLTDDERGELEAEGRKPHWRFLLPNHDGDPFSTRRTETRWNDLVLDEQIVDLASLSDPVLRRGDGTYLYTLPSVVDDADLAISTVLRGSDHVTNTGVQIALFEALGFSVPAFGHHNLLLAPDGDGLSKRTGSLALRELREQGYEPEAVIGVAALTGTSRPVEPMTLAQLAQTFDPSEVSASPSRLSLDELSSLNARVLHEMGYEAAKERLQALDCDLGPDFWSAVRANLERFADVRTWAAIVRGDGPTAELDDEDAGFVAQALDDLPTTIGPYGWREWTRALKARTERKGRALFMPLRLALTGLDYGPDLATFLPLMPRETIVARLQRHRLAK